MSELSLPTEQKKRDWTLTPAALDRLLIWLDKGIDSGGERYLEMQRRLVSYFDRKNCAMPYELADETLNRVARRLEEEGALESDTPERYCYIVARFVFLEHLREERKNTERLGNVRPDLTSTNLNSSQASEETDIKEQMLKCLEQCTANLEANSREIITRYYVGKERIKIENRRALAASLGLTMNALSIRACRIRDKLEVCVRKCVAEEK